MDISKLYTDGACVLKEVYRGEELEELRNHATEICQGDMWKPRGARNVSLAGPAEPTDPIFLKAIQKSAGLLSDIGFPDVRYIASVLVPKWKGEGRRPWHIDWWGWENLKDTCREIPPQIGFLIYLHDARSGRTREDFGQNSGSLIIWPGSHRREMHGHFDVWESTSHLFNDERYVEVEAGDAVLLDPRLMHAVHGNSRIDNRILLSLWFLLDWKNLEPRTQQTTMQSIPEGWKSILGPLAPDAEIGFFPHIKKPQFNITYERIDALRHGKSDTDIIGSAKQPGDDFIDTHDTYSWYRAIGCAKAPQRILELGVRYGYAGIALITGARWAGIQDTLYMGVDGEIDGIESNAIAEENLLLASQISKNGGPGGSVKLVKENTHNVEKVSAAIDGYGAYDVIHVDGDHSPEGIKAELQIAKIWVKPNGLILVDDCDTTHVCAATLDLCEEFGLKPIMLPTIHQTAVIDMRKRSKYQ